MCEIVIIPAMKLEIKGHQLLNAVLNRHLNRNGISGYSDDHTKANRVIFDEIITLPDSTPITLVQGLGILCCACMYRECCYVKPDSDDRALRILEEVLGIDQYSWTKGHLYMKISEEQYMAIRDKFYIQK